MSQSYLNTDRRRRLTYAEAAELISTHRFPVAPRTLEKWSDLKGIVVNKAKLFDPDDALRAADAQIAAAEAKAAALEPFND